MRGFVVRVIYCVVRADALVGCVRGFVVCVIYCVVRVPSSRLPVQPMVEFKICFNPYVKCYTAVCIRIELLLFYDRNIFTATTW